MSREQAGSVELRHVSVNAIREELRSLWASEAMNDHAVIRARTHNLVVYTADDVSAEETTQHVIEITSERPGRVIVIDSDGRKDDELDAWVTTYCRKVGTRQICGELITLSISAGNQDEIHSTVISLLAPDLPVLLWWMGVPDRDNRLFAELTHAADRIIIDTSNSSESYKLIARASSLVQWQLSDLSWARVTTWRKMLAQVWDLKEIRSDLASIRKVLIRFNSADVRSNAAGALLVAGWLIDCLKWKLKSVTVASDYEIQLHCKANRTEPLIHIGASLDEALPLGELVRVEIVAGNENHEVVPLIELQGQQSTILTVANSAAESSCRILNAYSAVGTPMALAQEIDLGYDPQYEAALLKASEILQLLDVK